MPASGRLLDLAKRRRPGGLQLWTFESNVRARRFYARHGFTVEERTDGSGNEERAPDMRYVWGPPVDDEMIGRGALMADADDVRRLALALPEVEEIDSEGFDFRVAGKGFVWSYPERTPGKPRRIRTDIAVLYVGDEAEKQALLLGEPELFFTAPGYGEVPFVLVRLEEVGTERLAELVTDAWRMRAPEALAAIFEGD
ncbi:MAG TPA: MmcQ/YjbR family DNA-binding protein [Streptosporangiaceae bacterium]